MVTKDPLKYCEIYKEQGCSHVDGYLCKVETCEERIEFVKLKENKMLKLYSFYWDCGRSGNLEGLFIAEESEVDKILGKEVYFGEVLGKHSEVSGIISELDIEVISEDQEKIEWLVSILGKDISGYNPLNYYEEAEGDPGEYKE